MNLEDRINYYIGDFIEDTPHYILIKPEYKNHRQNQLFYTFFSCFENECCPWKEGSNFINALVVADDGLENEGLCTLQGARKLNCKNNGILYKDSYGRNWNPMMELKDNIKFEDKICEPVWRGSPFTGREKNQRIPFVKRYYKKFNIGFYLNEILPSCAEFYKNNMSLEEQTKYKYILSVEGNSYATNLKWIFKSNSIVLMPKPSCECWFMEGLLQPFVHYVPLNDNLNNLEEMIDWCESNQKTCEEINNKEKEYVEQFLNLDNENFLINQISYWYSKNVIII